MKNVKSTLLPLFFLCFSYTAFSQQYIDITTGKTVTLVRHNGNGMMYNTETQKPVYIYIDPTTKDTFYGRTGARINGNISRSKEGAWMYTGDNEYVYKYNDFVLKSEADSAGYKKTFQRDGDVKVEYDGYKRKEEPDGDVKVKDNGAKEKVEGDDGTIKMKDGNTKVKVDEDSNLLIKDDSTKLKIKSEGSAKLKDKRTDYKSKSKTSGKTKEKTPAVKLKEKDGKVIVKEKQ